MSQPNVEGILINQSPRPRMLIRGFSAQADVVERLQHLVPTSRTIDSFDEVRQAEWDLLVTDQSLTATKQLSGGRTLTSEAERHLCVVALAPLVRGKARVEYQGEWWGEVAWYSGLISQELLRCRGLSDRVAALVHEQLEPVFKERSSHSYIEFVSFNSSLGAFPPVLEPFIASGGGKILAGRYRRSGESEAWLLPHDIPDIVLWVRAALAEWHGLAPSRFPGVPDWSERGEWMTEPEKVVSGQLEGLGRERESVLSELAGREDFLRRQLDDAREAADRYERALLTAQSSELVAAVTMALSEIGLAVTDADAEADPSDHLEDLRVTDPDVSDWIGLVEVKGYTKGAKTEALTQFLRFQARFIQRTGRLPDASWYIVNQFLGRDPSTRQPVLHGKDEDVNAFAQAGGLVIDTVVLFELLARIRQGAMTAEEARKLLRSSTGRLRL